MFLAKASTIDEFLEEHDGFRSTSHDYSINEQVGLKEIFWKKITSLLTKFRENEEIIDIRFTFSSNHNIHKSTWGLCFWAPDFSKIYQLKGLEPKNKGHTKLLCRKCISNIHTSVVNKGSTSLYKAKISALFKTERPRATDTTCMAICFS